MKILTVCDDPTHHTGVANQARNIIESWLTAGFEVVSIGWAFGNRNITPRALRDNWRLYPSPQIDSKQILRSLMTSEKPDAVWIMTDPNKFIWLWEMENEIRYNAPLVYYHVWDNKPYPKFNEPYYKSCDEIVSISSLTKDVVETVSGKKSELQFHTVDPNKLFPSEKEGEYFRKFYGLEDDIIFLWVNKNSQRKRAPLLISAYSEFAKENRDLKTKLVMRTNPLDRVGSNLVEVTNSLDFPENHDVMIFPEPIEEDEMRTLYNAADYTINISNAEGFGLTTLEGMACGTPMIATCTGGLKDQVDTTVGFPMAPDFVDLTGTQITPYIYDEYVASSTIALNLKKASLFKLNKPESYKAMSKKCLAKIFNKFNHKKHMEFWVEFMKKVHEEHGSWDTRNRENYSTWRADVI